MSNLVEKNVKRYCLYTVNTSNYDSLPKFRSVDPNLEIFYFTDDAEAALKTFADQNCRNRINVVDCANLGIDLSLYTSKKLSRYIKMNPHKILGDDADFAVYFDCRFDIKRLGITDVNNFHKSAPAAFLRHPFRTSALEEAQTLVKSGYINQKALEGFYEGEHLTESSLGNCKLAAAGFFSLDLRNPRTRTFLEEWWRLYDIYEGRDQLYLGLAAQRAFIAWDVIDLDYRKKNPFLFARPHKKPSGKRPAITPRYLISGVKSRLLSWMRRL